MNQAVLTTIAITGFGVAFFHAAIPTHWLPFVLTARVQRWNRARTIAITAFAGTGHVAVTALVGLFITWFGMTINKSIGNWFPRVAAGALLLFGLYYVFRQMAGKGHVHFPYPHEHLYENHGQLPEHPPHRVSDRAAIMSLLAFLKIKPLEGKPAQKPTAGGMKLLGAFISAFGWFLILVGLHVVTGTGGRIVLGLVGIGVSLFGIIYVLPAAFNKHAIWKS